MSETITGKCTDCLTEISISIFRVRRVNLCSECARQRKNKRTRKGDKANPENHRTWRCTVDPDSSWGPDSVLSRIEWRTLEKRGWITTGTVITNEGTAEKLIYNGQKFVHAKFD